MNTWYAIERLSAEHRKALLFEREAQRRVRAAFKAARAGTASPAPNTNERRMLFSIGALFTRMPKAWPSRVE
jgi:hypothetical protein